MKKTLLIFFLNVGITFLGNSSTPCDSATASMSYTNSGNSYTFTASHTMSVPVSYEYSINGIRVGSTIGSTNPVFTTNLSNGWNYVCAYVWAGGNFDTLPGIDSCFIYACDSIYVTGMSNSTPCDSATASMSYTNSGNSYTFTASHTMSIPVSYEYQIMGSGSTIGSTNPVFTTSLSNGWNYVCVYIGAGGNFDTFPGIDSCFIYDCEFIYVTGNSSSSIFNSTVNTIKIFPNPAKDILTIGGLDFKPLTIDVLDIYGKQIDIPTASNYIDVSNLSKGNYMLRLVFEDKIITKNFVKQ